MQKQPLKLNCLTQKPISYIARLLCAVLILLTAIYANASVDKDKKQILLKIEIDVGNCEGVKATDVIIKDDNQCTVIKIPKHDGSITDFYRGTSARESKYGNGRPKLTEFEKMINEALQLTVVKDLQLQKLSKPQDVKDFYETISQQNLVGEHIAPYIKSDDYVIKVGHCDQPNQHGLCSSRVLEVEYSQSKIEQLEADKRAREYQKSVKLMPAHINQIKDTVTEVQKSTTQIGQRLTNLDIKISEPPRLRTQRSNWYADYLIIALLSLLVLFSTFILMGIRRAPQRLELDSNHIEDISKKVSSKITQRPDATPKRVRMDDSYIENIAEKVTNKISQQINQTPQPVTKSEILNSVKEVFQQHRNKEKNLAEKLDKTMGLVTGMQQHLLSGNPSNQITALLNDNKNSIQSTIDGKIDGVVQKIQYLQQLMPESNLNMDEINRRMKNELGDLVQSLEEIVASKFKANNSEVNTMIRSSGQKLVDATTELKTEYNQLKVSLEDTVKDSLKETSKANDATFGKLETEIHVLANSISENKTVTSEIASRIQSANERETEGLRELLGLESYRWAIKNDVNFLAIQTGVAYTLCNRYEEICSDIRLLFNIIRSERENVYSQYCAFVLGQAHIETLLLIKDIPQFMPTLLLQKDQQGFIDFWSESKGDKQINLSSWMRLNFLLNNIVCPVCANLNHPIFEIKNNVNQLVSLLSAGAREVGVDIHNLSQNMNDADNDYYFTSSNTPGLMRILSDHVDYSSFLTEILQSKSSDTVIDVEIWGFSKRSGDEYFVEKKSVLTRKANLD